MSIITYTDSSVLIAGYAHTSQYILEVGALLIDARRVFVGSDFLQLEVLPKPIAGKYKNGQAYLETYFQNCVEFVKFSASMMQDAYDLACRYGLGGLDALHIISAIQANATELITLEKKTKPFYKVKEIRVIHLLDV